ncbi:MAG: iron-containing alcohol dehydrogenase [Myxococcota bacterium]
MTRAIDILKGLTSEAAEIGDPHRTRHIALDRDALDGVARWLQAERPGLVDVLIADDKTWDAAGRALEERLQAGGRVTHRLILEPREGDAKLVCETGAIAALEAFLRASDRMNPIAVGAGTVNDIVKMASWNVRRPYQAVPTAASMNGYTSSIAAVLADGVKRTWGCHQPEAIFADVDVIRRAPPVMNRAGFGDLLSKPYSHADWLLSHLVRGVGYSDEAARLLDESWQAMVEDARGIGEGEVDATRVLTETILVSGFSMAMAGSSAPASGAEHLVSHYWDMEELCQGRPVRALHGTQVGIGTRLSALLLERLVALEPEDIDPDAAAARRPDPSWIDGLASEHPDLTPEVLEEVQSQIRDKQRHGDALREEIASVKARWPEIRERLREALVPAGRVTRAIREAGCADRASALGVDRDHLVRTLRVSRHIRTRYVSFDLIDDLGYLDAWASEVAAETEEGG